MIQFGPMSITLLICAMQGLLLAGLLLRSRQNRVANRWLALLILAVVALITPFIIGYAGFYDRWPWLSFAPFSYTLAFGPLVYFYTLSLVDELPERIWPHFVPVTLQFLANALVFPLPLATKNWWNTLAHEPVIDPLFEDRDAGKPGAVWHRGVSALPDVSQVAGRQPGRWRQFRSELDRQLSGGAVRGRHRLDSVHRSELA